MKSIDRQEYVALCRARWSGQYLADARANFASWLEIHDELLPHLIAYSRDGCMEDVTGKQHNPEGTLTALLWKLQTAFQPDNSRLHPLLDFNESSQTIFLRRGLVAYCQLCLREIETIPVDGEPALDLAYNKPEGAAKTSDRQTTGSTLVPRTN